MNLEIKNIKTGDMFAIIIIYFSFQLKAVIRKILFLPVSSSVMKILTGVELLLKEAQVRWSTFAFCFNCLGMMLIIDLIMILMIKMVTMLMLSIGGTVSIAVVMIEVMV